MKKRKDIADLFQSNQHKLEERPPDRLWDRLEERLDQQRERRSIPMYRTWMMAAAAVGLILFVSIAALSQLRQQKQAQNMAQQEFAPLQWETLDMDQLTKEELGQLVAFRQQNRSRLKQPIPEGLPGKKILVKSRLRPTNRSPIASSQSAPIENGRTDELAMSEPSSTADFLEEVVPEPEVRHDDLQAYSTTTDREDEVITEEDVISSEGQAAPAAADDIAFVESVPAMANKTEQAAKDAGDRADLPNRSYSKKRQARQEVSDFNWLLGYWNQLEGAKRQVERWYLDKGGQLKGVGQLVMGKDTLFSEQMSIQQIDGQLYYIMRSEKAGSATLYQLKSYTQQSAVFENANVPFPQQVILNRQTGNKSFSTILQNNKKGKTEEAINERQRSYLSNRNAIGPQRVERKLYRSNK
ncbi:MAG: DUF6265 family protein [Bacteroidota bacterium]